ncbi:MAG: porin family protein [Proteobacteria bacterium]|nr:porin family protein [Pseudomonadota bacterium]
MKKYNFLIVFTALLFGSQQLQAKEGLYLNFSGTVDIIQDQNVEDTTSPPPNQLNISYDTAFGASGALGYAFENGFRFETEARHQWIQGGEITFGGSTLSASSSETDNFWAFMLNGYYDFNNSSDFVPYIGGGLGYTNIDADDSIFAGQVMAGIGYKLTDGTIIYTGYRFFSTLSDLKDSGLTADPLQIHSIELGLRFIF